MFVETFLTALLLHIGCVQNVPALVDWQQNDQQEKWSWGYEYGSEIQTSPRWQRPLPKREQPATTTTTTTLAPPKSQSDPCVPYKPEMPDFKEAGRSLSQVKCYEYIWAIKCRETNKAREALCRKKKGIPSILPIADTSPGEYPHMGTIGWKARVGTWVFLCGGSLISEKFVLTAAHCTRVPESDTVADATPKIVRLGDKNILDTFYRGYPPIDVQIAKIIVHPEYRSPKKYNDIALFELETPVSEFTSKVQPACLWSRDDLGNLGNQAAVTGWGVVETAGRTTSPELQSTVVDLLEPEMCNKLLQRRCNRNWCGLRNQTCAGKLEGGADSCQGDSGGPLQVKINLPPTVEGRIYYVIGVMSFGISCARENSAGIYTTVSSFTPWIESIVWPSAG